MQEGENLQFTSSGLNLPKAREVIRTQGVKGIRMKSRYVKSGKALKQPLQEVHYIDW